MILLFPDKPTLQLALTSGLLPGELASAPCEFAGHEDGRVWVKSEGELEKEPAGIAEASGRQVSQNHAGGDVCIAFSQLLAADSALGKNRRRERSGRTHAGAI